MKKNSYFTNINNSEIGFENEKDTKNFSEIINKNSIAGRDQYETESEKSQDKIVTSQCPLKTEVVETQQMEEEKAVSPQI